VSGEIAITHRSYPTYGGAERVADELAALGYIDGGESR